MVLSWWVCLLLGDLNVTCLALRVLWLNFSWSMIHMILCKLDSLGVEDWKFRNDKKGFWVGECTGSPCQGREREKNLIKHISDLNCLSMNPRH